MKVRGYVLAKDEAPNIERSVRALRACDVPVVVLDSGSTDGTQALAERAGATVEPYRYTTHREAYRFVTAERTPEGESALVLDADMIVDEAVVSEAKACIEAGAQVVEAPITMCWHGVPLRHASLCPPKAFMFVGGADYFEPVGHGERVAPGVVVRRIEAAILHDDRKALSAYLASQARYARSFVERGKRGELSLRDRVRARTPLLVMATPIASYLFRGGILDGWSGLGYALDRVIAEAIMTREAIAAALNDEER